MPGGSNFAKVSPGMPESQSPAYTAAWLNAVTDVVNSFASSTAQLRPKLDYPAGLVRVQNLVGSDLASGHYVQLGADLLTDVKRRKHIYEGNLYDAAEHGRVAVLTVAAKAEEIQVACTLGLCRAVVNVTDTGHRFASPDDGAHVLKSAASGSIEILSTNKITGTGEQELKVLLGGGGGGTRKARVTTTISAAAGPLTADWGAGEVKLQDAATGELAADASEVTNDNIGTSWAVDCQVTLDMSYSPPRVIGGSCGAVSWGEA